MSAYACLPRSPFVIVLAAAFVAATAAPAMSQTISKTCSASSSWVENPTLPESLDESNHCNFAIFSWQSFLALMQPSGGPDGQLVFESYMSSDALFVSDREQPAPWGQSPWPGRPRGIGSGEAHKLARHPRQATGPVTLPRTRRVTLGARLAKSVGERRSQPKGERS